MGSEDQGIVESDNKTHGLKKYPKYEAKVQKLGIKNIETVVYIKRNNHIISESP